MGSEPWAITSHMVNYTVGGDIPDGAENLCNNSIMLTVFVGYPLVPGAILRWCSTDKLHLNMKNFSAYDLLHEEGEKFRHDTL